MLWQKRALPQSRGMLLDSRLRSSSWGGAAQMVCSQASAAERWAPSMASVSYNDESRKAGQYPFMAAQLRFDMFALKVGGAAEFWKILHRKKVFHMQYCPSLACRLQADHAQRPWPFQGSPRQRSFKCKGAGSMRSLATAACSS